QMSSLPTVEGIMAAWRRGTLLLVAALLAATTTPARAAVWSYDFGALLSGTYAPPGTFASLSISTTDNKTFLFDLKARDLDTQFAPGAFITRILVNTVSNADPTSVNLVGTGWGVSRVVLDTNPPHVGSIAWDFGESFCGGSNCSLGNSAGNRLTAD